MKRSSSYPYCMFSPRTCNRKGTAAASVVVNVEGERSFICRLLASMQALFDYMTFMPLCQPLIILPKGAHLAPE